MNQVAERQNVASLPTRNNVGQKLAARFGLDETMFMSTIKATVFKGASDAQMAALMVVSDQYGLNPFTKEIYAFPDRNNGIVPVVGVDGWSRIINSHPQFDGMEFDEGGESCKCVIYRKDRKHSISVTEYMAECKRDQDPWKTHPRRMLRHKAMIQCARLAFGFAGIYDPDEAERIIEATAVDDRSEATVNSSSAVEQKQKALYDAGEFDARFDEWARHIKSGKTTADRLIPKIETKGALTEDQKIQLNAIKIKEATE